MILFNLLTNISFSISLDIVSGLRSVSSTWILNRSIIPVNFVPPYHAQAIGVYIYIYISTLLRFLTHFRKIGMIPTQLQHIPAINETLHNSLLCIHFPLALRICPKFPLLIMLYCYNICLLYRRVTRVTCVQIVMANIEWNVNPRKQRDSSTGRYYLYMT